MQRRAVYNTERDRDDMCTSCRNLVHDRVLVRVCVRIIFIVVPRASSTRETRCVAHKLPHALDLLAPLALRAVAPVACDDLAVGPNELLLSDDGAASLARAHAAFEPDPLAEEHLFEEEVRSREDAQRRAQLRLERAQQLQTGGIGERQRRRGSRALLRDKACACSAGGWRRAARGRARPVERERDRLAVRRGARGRARLLGLLEAICFDQRRDTIAAVLLQLGNALPERDLV